MDKQIKEIIEAKSYKPIIYLNPNTKIKTKYLYKAITQNFIYYI